MRKQLTLQTYFAFNDLDLLLIASMTRGKNAMYVLFAINTLNKMNRLEHNFFRIPSTILQDRTGLSDSAIRREVKWLVDNDFLRRLEGKGFCWNLVGINSKINPPENKKPTETKIKGEKLVFNKLDINFSFNEN
jgi:hypothetical protein